MGKAKLKVTTELDPSSTMQLPATDESTPIAPHPSEDKLDRILAAVEHTRECLESKIDTVAANLSLLRDDHKKLSERVTATERSLSEFQPTSKELQSQLHELTDRVRFLEGRVEDAQGRTRRSNIYVSWGFRRALRALTQ